MTIFRLPSALVSKFFGFFLRIADFATILVITTWSKVSFSSILQILPSISNWQISKSQPLWLNHQAHSVHSVFGGVLVLKVFSHGPVISEKIRVQFAYQQ